MAALDITFYVLSALAGLCIGSFLNVCIYRLPRGKFFSKTRSFCPKCGEAIKAYDNIPLLSYVILRGKCRSCGERISPRYPLVEAMTCALFVGNYAMFGMHGLTLVWDVAACALITASFIDLDTMEIPDSAVLVLLALGLVTFAPFGGMGWEDKLIGCACVSVPMFLLAMFGGMGLGDVKLYFVLGLMLGWQKVLIVFVVSVVLGAAVSVIVTAVKKRRGEEEFDLSEEEYRRLPRGAVCAEGETPLPPKKMRFHVVPFGPFIALATVVAIFGGDALIAFYAGLLGI